jgi:hypothetical protein
MLARIFWIDGLSALSAGLFVLSLRSFLAELYVLPLALITFVGLVNVAYSSLGLALAVRKRRPLALIVVLSGANAFWAAVCVVLAVSFGAQAHPLGLGHILFEGAYCATLASLEWRNRSALANA